MNNKLKGMKATLEEGPENEKLLGIAKRSGLVQKAIDVSNLVGMASENDISEFIALVDSRCNFALQNSEEYLQFDDELANMLKEVDKETAIKIDDIISRQQAIVEKLIYKQGLRDALSLLD